MVKVVQEFPALAYYPGAIPPGSRQGSRAKPRAIVVETNNFDENRSWVAVEYVSALELGAVNRAIEDNFLAQMILVVGYDGTAIAGYVAVTSAYPFTLPSPLEIEQEWPLERVVRETLRRSFSL